MPIPAHLRHFYRGKAYEAFRARIIARAKNRCEQCGKPNHKRVWVVSGRNLVDTNIIPLAIVTPHVLRSQYWTATKHDRARWNPCTVGGGFGPLKILKGAQWKAARRIRIICTLAHLNHVAGDDRDDNAKFLCQWCHLNYDKLHHKETRMERKDAARPILQELSA